MRNFKKQLQILFFLLLCSYRMDLVAQNHKNTIRKSEIFELFNQIESAMLLFPADIKRVVLFDVQSNLQSVPITNTEIRSILTQKLNDVGLNILVIPELDPNNVLTFNSNDSNLKIENRSPLNRIKNQPDKIRKLCVENSVQSLLQFQIFYDSVFGPRMYMSAMNPRNMEIIWFKNIRLNNNYIANRSVFEALLGIGIQGITQISNSIDDPGAVLTKNLQAVYYNLGINYNTALTVRKNIYLGFHGVLKVINQTPIEYKDTNLGTQQTAYLPSGGVNCTFHFLKKSNFKPEYWTNFKIGLNYYNYNSHTLGIEQQLNFEVSNSLRIGIRYEQTFNEFTTYNNKNKRFIFLDKTNYGFQATFTF